MSCVKLFGWTIPSASHDQLLPSSVLPDSFDHSKENHSLSSSSCSLSLQPHMDMMNNESITSNSEQNHTSLNKESKETSENSDEQHSEITTSTTSEEKTTDLKKPDKILPCPRCNSQDTKFCYYNNYNVNQPRHFCRNCQRYWTSGGTMRMVPVGSGRRKHKTWVSSDHITNNHNTSSTKILSFESSDSLVTENKEHDNFRGFLPMQVTSSVSSPWPYQYSSFNPSFYNMPVYWGVTVPVWSTLETSTCLGKRTRDEEDSHGSDKESKDNFLRARFVPETYLNLQANPAAMARSINFMESM